MTPDDLDAIRGRDATRYTISTQLPIPDGILVLLQEAVNDRRDLLAEVDRLMAESEFRKVGWKDCFERLRATVAQRDAERARIRAAVESEADAMAHFFAVGFGLRILTYEQAMALERGVAAVIRAAVLAAIDGEAT